MVLIYRYMDENYLPVCQNDALKKAISLYSFSIFIQDISITNDVAAHASISERYLRSLFLQYLNFSPLDYLNQIRINKSIELLRNTELSVKRSVSNVIPVTTILFTHLQTANWDIST